jgi:uncharacterized membrane protein YvlD (DUF360 family)
MEQNQSKNKNFWSLKLDDADLKNQIENYQSLKITQTYRGKSVLIILALLVFSLILSMFGIYADPVTMIIGIMIYLPILFFVYKGHRWAIILLMVMYTYEKGFNIYEISKSGNGSGISSIIWWLIVMPYFWKALYVENKRRELPQIETVNKI